MIAQNDFSRSSLESDLVGILFQHSPLVDPLNVEEQVNLAWDKEVIAGEKVPSFMRQLYLILDSVTVFGRHAAGGMKIQEQGLSVLDRHALPEILQQADRESLAKTLERPRQL